MTSEFDGLIRVHIAAVQHHPLAGQAGPFVRESGDDWTELLPPGRFLVHEACTAEHTVHRVAAVLVAIDWGPEYFDDRDSISGGRSVRSTVYRVDPRRLGKI